MSPVDAISRFSAGSTTSLLWLDASQYFVSIFVTEESTITSGTLLEILQGPLQFRDSVSN
jgi:hypothetical protein